MTIIVILLTLFQQERQLTAKCLYGAIFHAFLTKVEPKNYKEAMKESSWIEAIQDKIHEFEQLEVWKLGPRPSNVMLINLKWIFKVKLDEYVRVLKNKTRVVAKGFCQEESIDFKESLPNRGAQYMKRHRIFNRLWLLNEKMTILQIDVTLLYLNEDTGFDLRLRKMADHAGCQDSKRKSCIGSAKNGFWRWQYGRDAVCPRNRVELMENMRSCGERTFRGQGDLGSRSGAGVKRQ
ncbi:retrovirus-related pol polyprotein from transposon TNT 1-94 [Tanacetum coccineum]